MTKSKKKIVRKTSKKKIVKKTKKKVKKKELTIYQRALLSERTKKFNLSATPEDCIKDLRKVQETFPLKSITRNFYRANGKYSDSTWNRYFGSFEEFQRQAGLKLTRHQHKLERDIALHASRDHYRTFFESEILPYCNKYPVRDQKTHPLRLMAIMSDMHDLECDRFGLAVFLNTIKQMQPDIIVMNGDIYDLYEFSRWEKDPRSCDIVKRFKFVRWVIGQIRAACPNSQIDLIMGNHEFRLLKHMADKTPYMKILLGDVMNLTLEDIFGIREFGINMIAKWDLAAHKAQEIRDQIKKNFEIYYDCFACTHEPDPGMGISGTNGHLHKLVHNTDTNLHHNNISWVQTPALHRMDAVYIRGRNKADMGFLMAHINIETGEVVQNPHILQESWGVVNGVFYRRSDYVYDQEE